MTVPWMPLLRRTIEAEGAKPMVLGLATVDASGMPRVRSVVCRQATDDGLLWITSDARSAKNEQLRADPRASAVYWAAASRRQFRFSGRVAIRASPDDSQRKEIWQGMNPEIRAAFFWPTPGAARAPVNAFVAVGDVDVPPETFSLLVLEPTTVEFLDVSISPHVRQRWTKVPEWEGQDINP